MSADILYAGVYKVDGLCRQECLVPDLCMPGRVQSALMPGSTAFEPGPAFLSLLLAHTIVCSGLNSAF